MSEFNKLSLFKATLEQRIESRKRTYSTWGRSTTEQEWIDAWYTMEKREGGKHGKFVTWVLADRDDPTSLLFKCACETYHRHGLTLESNTEDSTCRNVVCYAIASVFTPLIYRNYGYATHMMRLLHWVLAPSNVLPDFPARWGAPPDVQGAGNAKFSVLYSDIGDFYTHCGPSEQAGDGWQIRGRISTIWELAAGKNTFVESGNNAQLKWLGKDEVENLWIEDAKLMKKDVEADSEFGHPSKKAFFTFMPDKGVGEYLMLRAAFFDMDTGSAPLPYWGVEIQLDKDSLLGQTKPVFATWTIDVRPPPRTLIITRLRAGGEHFTSLMTAILEFSRQYGFEQVEIWNLPLPLRKLAETDLEGKTIVRADDEHLPMFKWYGKENPDKVEWLFNEKFCWC